MPNFSQMTDDELFDWAKHFLTVVSLSPADYAVTAGQLTDFQTTNNTFGVKITDRIAKEEAASAAVVEQDAFRKLVEPLCSFYNTTIKANPDVTDTAKVAAGIDLKKPPTRTPPVAPTDLVVNGFENGTNVLKWNRADNKTSTQFIVEYREAAETEFEYLGTTTKTNYKHEGATPGMQCVYRVKAQRAGEESPYSNTAVVYLT